METLKKCLKQHPPIRDDHRPCCHYDFFQIITGGLLLEPINITNLILQNSYILVLAIGMVLVIITGHIDLSVGSVAAFVGAVAAIMMVDMQLHPVIAVIVSLIVGGLIGAWQDSGWLT